MRSRRSRPAPSRKAATERAVSPGQLIQSADKLNVAINLEVSEYLLRYVDLLLKWNRAYNLTAIRDRADMISGHVLDSLSIAPHINGERILDVGTGAGLPGLVLALQFPERRFVLLDSNGKKTRFLQEAQIQLPLANVEIQRCRVEDYAPAELFDQICSRAFTALPQFVAHCGHLLRPGGVLLAMLGRATESELSEIPNPFKLQGCLPLAVPGITSPRHLAIIAGP